MSRVPSIRRLGDSAILFAGVDPAELRDPDDKVLVGDRVRYMGMGISVVVTSVFACVAMPLALTVMTGHFSPLYLIAGLLYGAFIMNFDRWLVSGFDYDTGWKATVRAVAGVLIRLPIAVLIAFSIAEPIVMFVFASEVDAKIAELKQHQKVEEADKIRADPFYAPDRTEEAAAVARANAAVDTAAKALSEAESALDSEEGGTGGTGRAGQGTRTNERREVRNKAKEAYDDAIGKQIDAGNKYTFRAEQLDADRKKAIDANNDRIDKRTAGLADREKALSALGDDPAIAKTALAVRGLLFLIDVAPLLLKYAMPETFHEKMLRARRRRLLDRHADDIQAAEIVANDRRTLKTAIERYRLQLKATFDEEQLSRNNDFDLRELISDHAARIRSSGFVDVDAGFITTGSRNPFRGGTGSSTNPEPSPMPGPPPPKTETSTEPREPDPPPPPTGDGTVVDQRWLLGAPLTPPRADHPWLRAYLARDLHAKGSGDYVVKRIHQPGPRVTTGLNELHSLPPGVEVSPYVAPMVHGGYDVDFGLFVVTRYYRRGTLTDRMRDDARPLTLRDTLRYAEQVLQGLDAVFEDRNLIHFDIKPSNIALDDNGNVRIIDWGLAAAGDAADGAPTGYSLWYAPPEQVATVKQPKEWRSGRCDVRAVGATLYHLIAGTPPLQMEAEHLRLLDTNGVLPDERKHDFEELLQTISPTSLKEFFSANEGWDIDQMQPLSDLLFRWLDPDPAMRAPGNGSPQRNALDALRQVAEQLVKNKSAALDRKVGAAHLKRPLISVTTPGDRAEKMRTTPNTQSTVVRPRKPRAPRGPDPFTFGNKEGTPS
ncbi:DUF4407 domain-containing protein [Nocardia bovistercoris]|uniref:non-specific serine/threonine protein kinase n=1 Tax=Nocardia bovistercoris TaxID=2785916 RepID=A0A931N205_9NOCA|nr:DUF4407 domain-containing protein [Nocardia bovistercoris]